MKLITLPFHWVHPSAPAKYVGCRAAIAVYDPSTDEIDEKRIREARLRIFDAAVGSVSGARYRGPKLPKSVLVPTCILHMTRKDFGRGQRLSRLSLERLGFCRFNVDDLAKTPFAKCPYDSVPMRTLRKFERICG